MGPPANQDLVESVRAAGDIVRLVSEFVPLKPAGSGRLKGLCPFHKEKTPSFSVHPGRGLFYCFGCQAGGDLFKFVMLYENLGFREAVELLAQRWGVALPARRGEGGAVRTLLRVNREAVEFFRGRFADPGAGRLAREYLAGRGIEPSIAARLGVGYAPDDWEALRGHLLGRGFSAADLLAAGLVIPRKDGRGEYDRFRGRLIFPIRDAGGRPVAFGGRALAPEAEPKYLNSPETKLYVKGRHLYGLDLAREAIRRAGCAVVVEGYLDLAAVLQAGVDHAVASLGTAFTPEQARLLARFTTRAVVSYDGDAAGLAAATRTLDMLLDKGFDVRVVELPGGLDPDDFIRREGPEAYHALLDAAPPYLEFLLRREAEARDISKASEKVAAVNALLPRIARLTSPIERASWAGRIGDVLRIDDELILQELRSALRSARGQIRQKPSEAEPLREAEARLVSLLLEAPAARSEDTGSSDDAASPEETARGAIRASIEPEDVAGTRVAGIVEAILRLGDEGRAADYPRVLAALETDEERGLLTRIAFREYAGDDASLEECLAVLRRDRLVRERREIQTQIEGATEPALIDALLARKQQIGKQIDALS